MIAPFQRAYPPAQPNPGQRFWLPFRNDTLLIEVRDERWMLIEVDETTPLPEAFSPPLYVGTLHGVPCLTFEVDADFALPENWQASEIRRLYGRMDEHTYTIIGYASHILRWQRESRFCPICGHPLEHFVDQWSRRCTNCSYVGYPPVTPAILALVHDGERVLLAHKPGWGKRYSIIAGFVEPGESFEECVRREVMEEVGVEVTDITYAGSQPWPFPNQIMVGFTARYLSGEVRPDQEEIDLAGWFRFDQLPELPPALSLSRQLIDRWVQRQRENREENEASRTS